MYTVNSQEMLFYLPSFGIFLEEKVYTMGIIYIFLFSFDSYPEWLQHKNFLTDITYKWLIPKEGCYYFTQCAISEVPRGPWMPGGGKGRSAAGNHSEQ